MRHALARHAAFAALVAALGHTWLVMARERPKPPAVWPRAPDLTLAPAPAPREPEPSDGMERQFITVDTVLWTGAPTSDLPSYVPGRLADARAARDIDVLVRDQERELQTPAGPVRVRWLGTDGADARLEISLGPGDERLALRVPTGEWLSVVRPDRTAPEAGWLLAFRVGLRAIDAPAHAEDPAARAL